MSQPAKFRPVAAMLRLILRILSACVLVAIALVVLFRWVNPPATYLMIREWADLGAIQREWRPLSDMSDDLALSAAAAEDANFCEHFGFDLAGIRAAISDDTRLRGGSTITQQVAKNVFLWPQRSWLRKGLEAGFAGLIELIWPKRRIMEVYLNVAEFDRGVFGAQAAAQRYWSADAMDLGPQRAARLMAVLPDPKRRSPVSGTRFIAERGAAIASGAATLRLDGRANCFMNSGP